MKKCVFVRECCEKRVAYESSVKTYTQKGSLSEGTHIL